MNFCALGPPNSRTLSDTVIGNVLPRTTIRHRGTTSRHIRSQDSTLDYSPQQRNSPSCQSAQKKQKKPVQPLIDGSLERNGKASKTVELLFKLVGQTDLATGRKSPSCIVADLNTAQQMIASIQQNLHPITEELKHAIVVEALKQKVRYRERWRLSQTRYRNKQQKIKTDIQDDISKLQYEIEQLEAKRKGSSRLSTSPTFWSIAAEYMRHFSYYVSSPGSLQPTTSRYLHDIMAPDVIVGSSFGAQAQLENWTLFALYFDDVQLELRGMNMLTSDTLVAFTIITITITSNTLRRAFPHLNSDGCGGTNGGSWAPLAIQMLDQKLVLYGSVVFGWDNVLDKVVRVEFQADMMTPMTKLLGNLSKVSCVFEQARVTPDCRILN